MEEILTRLQTIFLWEIVWAENGSDAGTSDTGGGSNTGFPWFWLILAIVVVVIIVAAVVVLLIQIRRMQKAKAAGQETTPDPILDTEARFATEDLEAEGIALPDAGLRITIGKVHGQGTRDYQEDSFSVSPEELYPTYGLLAVVADGMGGLRNGDRVSQTAVSTIMNQFIELVGDAQLVLLQLACLANTQVNAVLGNGGIGQCGSTLVAGLLKDSRFYYISIGDSRICLYRDGALFQLNREHVYRNELLVRAVNREIAFTEALSHPRAAGLTSFLGMGQIKSIDIPAEPVTVRPGDCFILMSDGVYNAITKEELAAALSSGDAQACADAVGAAVEAKAWPGQDNYTAVILQCE